MKRTQAERPHDHEILLLENQLCFALYAATRAITRTYRERLEPLGLTYPQYLVMLVLWDEDGITISHIGRKLKLDSGTLTPLLKRLENMELVARRRGIKDEREVQIWLTQKGFDLETSVVDVRRYVACSLEMKEHEIRSLRADVMDVIDRLEADRLEIARVD